MAAKGRIPKRKDQLNGHRSKDELEGRTVTRLPSGAPAHVAPQPYGARDWHPIAKRIWKAAGESGQSILYTASDWAVLYSLMDDLTYYKNSAKRSGQMLQTIMSSLTSLLLTEGDRRRLQVELHHPEPETTTPGAEEVEKWLSQMSPPSSPTSARTD